MIDYETQKLLMREYDDVLLGNYKFIDNYYFTNKSAQTQQEVALFVIRYCIENYLGWTPEMVRDHFNQRIIEQWHLQRMYKRIIFPLELDKKKDFYWVAHLLYPNIICVKYKDRCLATYKRVLGEEKGSKPIKYPKGFFSDEQATDKACICLKYAIATKCVFTSIKDMYFFFNSEKGDEFLDRNKLSVPAKRLFSSNIAFLHRTLNDDEKDDDLFDLLSFTNAYNEYLEKKEAEKNAKAKDDKNNTD